MRWIDSHCHLDGEGFDHDREEVLARARAAGVSPLIVVGTGGELAQLERAVALAEREADVWAVVGVHPHDAARFDPTAWAALEELARHPRVVAVGEIGLDFHYDHSPRDAQEEVFRRQVRLARTVGRPVVCHVREAHDEALAVLASASADAGAANVDGVIHCFTGGPREAEAYLALGLYISFSGIVTFPARSVDPIRQAVRVVPYDRLLIETDAPYLAPVPFRGRRNEPAYVVHTAAALAELTGLSLFELATATNANTSRLFRLTP